MWRLINGKWVLFAPETGSGSGGDTDEPQNEPEDDLEGDEPQDEPEDDLEGDEPQDEPQDDPEDEPQDEPAPQRRNNRFQRQANELRSEREARIRAEERARILEESRSHQPAATNTAEAERIRAEKLALMDPQEKQNFLLQEEIAGLKRSQQASQIQLQESMDLTGFKSAAAVDPVRAKYADKVEALHNEYLKKGQWVPRETAFTYLLGEAAKKKLEAVRRSPQKKQRAREDAQARVDSARGARVTARDDGGRRRTGKGDDLDSLTARLRDVQL